MNRLITLWVVVLVLISSPMKADNFAVLWKKYEQTKQKDLPKTSLHVLEQIIKKAETEQKYGHLLKASFLHGLMATQISPDSTTVELTKLKERLRQAERKDRVLAAVYQSALGQLYAENLTLGDNSVTLSEQYFKQSLAEPALLASYKSATYEPFTVSGVDSKIFNHDLLHVLGFEAQRYDLLHQYYLSHENRPAACITALYELREKYRSDVLQAKKSKYIQKLDSLIAVYKDLTEAGEVAIERYQCIEEAEDISAEQKIQYINYALMKWGAWPRINILRNAKTRLTLPTFHVSLGDAVAIPHQERQVVVLQLCNIQQLNMAVWRVNVNGDTQLDPNDARDYARLRPHIDAKTPVYTTSKQYVGMPDYQMVRDTMTIKGLPVGVYLVELTTDNKAIQPQRALLRVSDVYLLSQSLPHHQLRMVAVSATTGQPLSGAKIQLRKDEQSGRAYKQQVYTCNQEGEVTVTIKENRMYYAYPYTQSDKACAMTYLNGYGFFPKEKKSDALYVHLFTDRSIYRPGQTVHASAVAFRLINGKETTVATHQTLTLTLRDANYKEVGVQKVTTDEYGTAVADFVLPSTGFTGTYSLRSNQGRDAYASLSVEEYKRPTFYVEFDTISTKYQEGDTVKLAGHVKSFAGVPVVGAQVKYTITRSPMLWRYFEMRDRTQNVTIDIDTLATDNSGKFVINVPMIMPEKSNQAPQHYSFLTKVDVTDGAGETHHAENALMLSDKPTTLLCDLAKQSRTDSIKPMTFSYLNSMGVAIDGDVHYTIDGKSYHVKANQPTLHGLERLSSGEHHLIAVCGQDTLSHTFYTFSLDDKRPAFKTSNFFYLTDTTFPNDGKSVQLMLGSSDTNVHVVYSFIAGDRVIESGSLAMSNQIIKKKLKYQPQYADGLLLNYAWVKNGKCYTHRQLIAKPQPDKRLMLTWKTFRNRLTPGQKETWTLQIKTPNGKPAKAQLMAVLFDKTLQEIKEHAWRYYIPYQPAWATTFWEKPNIENAMLYGDAPFTPLRERPINFTYFDDVFAGFGQSDEVVVIGYGGGVRTRALSKLNAMSKAEAFSDETMSVDGAHDDKSLQLKQKEAMPASQMDSSTKQNAQPTIRENFNETAFFFPALIADDKGQVSLKFTLPESVTTWQFMGLAHDEEMRHGLLMDETVAQKKVMIQPNMPRFVRKGDQLTISARVMSTSQRIETGTACIELVDPATEKVVFTQQKSYELQPEATDVVTFAIDMIQLLKAHPKLSLLVVRFTAKGKNYSDGEQHYLPILTDDEWVTTTIPFTLHDKGVKTIDLQKLFPTHDDRNLLTVEYTQQPAWLMVQTLPNMGNIDDDNAMSLVAAYYANSIGQHLFNEVPQLQSVVKLWKQEKGKETSLTSALEKNKELKTVLLNETPWVMNAQNETYQQQQLVEFFDSNMMSYRLTSLLQKLSKLQNTDGSFSWWKGMSGSRYMTVAVVMTLARLNTLIGHQTSTQSMITSSLRFLDRKLSEEVAELKARQAKGEKDLFPSEFACNCLYTYALLDKRSNGNINYMVNLLSQQPTVLSIYGKARTAVILSLYGKQAKANEYLQSIQEYSVYTEEMGRYFDAPRANYSWFSYRIPTQVAAIEAMKLLKPNDPSIEEMQRWLLQSKRTQAWDTPINSVNAVYAFLHGQTQKLTTGSQSDRFQLNGQPLEMPNATAGLGYVKTAKTGKDMRQLTIDKTSAGTSWGAVYAQFMQKSTEVVDQSSGLKVTRTLLRDGKPVQTFKVGDRVIVRLVVEANRDYDFVQLQDKRAACLEPLHQRSGYAWGYYYAPKDNVTSYYFDQLSKGKHVIETEYFIDRAGTYQTGICTIQCAYSPDFNGRAAGQTLKISEK